MRNLRTGIFVLLAIGMMTMVSCRKDKGPITITPPLPPDQTISYSAHVQPIFEAGSPQCTACHPTSGNLALMGGNSYNAMVNVVSDGYAPAVLVVPGDTTNSVLWDKINNYGVYGMGMPPPSGGLSQGQIDTIGLWIMEGALDN